MRTITECDGYKKLLAAVEDDEKRKPNFHDYRGRLQWVLDRAAHYAEKTGLDAADLLDYWEERRDYWYMNYYQEANQPEIKGDKVRVFETSSELLEAVKDSGFRCPGCGGVSKDPYKCNSGRLMDEKNVCNWKAYGFLRTLGKGVTVFVKEALRVEEIFMPVAWEK